MTAKGRPSPWLCYLPASRRGQNTHDALHIKARDFHFPLLFALEHRNKYKLASGARLQFYVIASFTIRVACF